MGRALSGNGISDPVQIRALRLVTPRQFGILVGHGETSVMKWVRRGWITLFTALDTSNVLIRIEEVDRFLTDREREEQDRRVVKGRHREGRATAANARYPSAHSTS